MSYPTPSHSLYSIQYPVGIFLSPLLPLLLAHKPANEATGTLDTALDGTGRGLAALRNRAGHVVGRAGRVLAVVALALALDAVHALARGHVADGLREAALADLAGHEVVDAVLQGVDLLDAGDLGLVEVFCYGNQMPAAL